MVDYCNSISKGTKTKFDFMITTNGWFIDDDFIRFSKRNSIEIGISIDGIKQAHNMHRKTTLCLPTFERVYEACKKLLAALPGTYAMLTVNPDTVEFLFESIKFLRKTGFKTIAPVPNLFVEWTKEDFQSLKCQYELMANWYESLLLKGKKFNLPIFANKLVNQIGSDKCVPAKHRISIDVNGDIFPCIQYVDHERYKIGCVSNGCQISIDNKKLKHIVDENKQGIDECRNCDLESRCDNKCGCKNILSNDSAGKSLKVCNHERILIPIADVLWGKILC